MSLGERHGSRQDKSSHIQSLIFTGELFMKLRQRGSHVMPRDRAVSSAPDEGQNYFNSSNSRPKNEVSGSRINNTIDPLCACLLHIAFNDCTAIEKVNRQIYPRSSMIVSDTGLPFTLTG
jgi:hypothetical protein